MLNTCTLISICNNIYHSLRAQLSLNKSKRLNGELPTAGNAVIAGCVAFRSADYKSS